MLFYPHVTSRCLRFLILLTLLFIFSFPVFADDKETEAAADTKSIQRIEALKARAKLREVETTLKKEFIGWDEEIGRMMAAGRMLKLHAELVVRPIVIPMISFPGYGKTTLIQRFLELMEWKEKFIQKSLVEGQVALPSAPILSLANVKDVNEGFQGAILLDEMQKLKNQKELDPDTDSKDEQAKTHKNKEVDLVSERNKEHEVWWNFLGNGTYVEKRTPTIAETLHAFKAWFDHYRNHNTQINNIRTQLENVELELTNLTPDRESLRPSLVQNIGHYKNQIVAQEKTVLQYQSNVEELLMQHRSNKDLFEDYARLSDYDIFLELIKDPDAMQRNLQARAKKAPAEIVKYFRRGIVFALANPEALIKKILDEVGESKKNPDRMRAVAERIAKKEDIDHWFHEKFGYVPGWDSRWQLSDWHLKMPFTEVQWRQMVESRLANFSDTFHRSMKEFEVDSKMEFDSSVHQAFFESGVDSVNGPRVLYTNAPQILGSFLTELEDSLLMMDKDKAPKKLAVHYDSKTSKMVATEVKEGSKKDLFKFEHAVSFPKNEEALAPQAAREILERQSNHMAGHAIAGMLMFGTLPKLLTRESKPSDIGIDLMWDSPALQSHENKLNNVVALLGGWAGEQMLSKSAFVSENARLDIIQAEKLLREVMVDLKLRQRLLSFSEDKPLVSLAEVIPKDMERMPGYKKLKIVDGDMQLALKEVQELVYDLLKNNKEFTEILSERLQERKTISADELKQLMSKHLVTISSDLEYALKYNIPGSSHRKTCEMALGEVANGPYRQNIFRRLYKQFFVSDLK